MKSNSYTEHMKNIIAPKNLVDKTISKLQSADIDNTKILLTKKKHRGYKFIGAVAAVLALVIGFTVISIGSSKPDDEHDFVITAGAAEITPDVYVELGELCTSGSGASFRPKNQDPNNRDFCGEFDLLGVYRMFEPHEFDIKGDNIESITYSTKNCRLAYDARFEGIVNIERIPENESQHKHMNHFYDSYKWVKSCTFDYEIMKNDIESGRWYGNPKIGIEFAFEFEEGEHPVYIESKHEFDDSAWFEKEFSAHCNDFSLDITADFEDGKSVTKTLKFRCENTPDRSLVLYAIEV